MPGNIRVQAETTDELAQLRSEEIVRSDEGRISRDIKIQVENLDFYSRGAGLPAPKSTVR